MRSPFGCENERAFDPFYDESAVVKLKSGKKQTLVVSVFDDIEGQTLLEDGSIDTARHDIQLRARQSDWCFVQTMKRGDTIELPRRGKYSVSEVKNEPALGIIITARSI